MGCVIIGDVVPSPVARGGGKYILISKDDGWIGERYARI
jgi:hypothetical protein